MPISATLDTTGPMTRSVADAVTLFNAMTGYDENDLAMPLLSADFALEYRTVDLTGKRLGVLESFADDMFYQSALGLLSENGAAIVEVLLDYERREGFSELLGGEMVRDLALYLQSYSADEVQIDSIASLRAFNESDMDTRAPYGQGLVDMMDALELSGAELASLTDDLQSNARTTLQQLFDESNLDVLLSINNRHAGVAALANFPALTIPMGYEASGRPIGLTLIAPSFREQDLIDIGARFEQLSTARKMPEQYQ